jgi:photosystem II stability/assembly factor-like uncharacterized protein
VQALGDTVWAFGTAATDGSPVVLSSPVAGDQWSTADVGLTSTDLLAAPVVADGVVGAIVTHAEGQQEFVRSRDNGSTWQAVPAPAGCQTPLSSSGIEGAVWLHCSSATGDAVLAVSADAGDTWSQQSLPPPGSALTTMTGIDSEHALVTDATALSIVTVASDGGAVEPVPGPYTADADVWADASGYTYAGFTDPETGYLITSGGALARTDDGGHHWEPVKLP